MQETVFEHLAGNGMATVTAAERWSIGMVKRLAEKHPEDVEIVAENADGTLVAHVPAGWMKLRPPRRVNLTDEQRAAASERMKAARNAKR